MPIGHWQLKPIRIEAKNVLRNLLIHQIPIKRILVRQSLGSN